MGGPAITTTKHSATGTIAEPIRSVARPPTASFPLTSFESSSSESSIEPSQSHLTILHRVIPKVPLRHDLRRQRIVRKQPCTVRLIRMRLSQSFSRLKDAVAVHPTGRWAGTRKAREIDVSRAFLVVLYAWRDVRSVR